MIKIKHVIIYKTRTCALFKDIKLSLVIISFHANIYYKSCPLFLKHPVIVLFSFDLVRDKRVSTTHAAVV